jgi:transcriptional regulator with XRE-family HTH domain
MTAIMNIREIFARNLRKQRQARGLSQEKLAHLAGIDRTYVSSLERCVYAPTIDMVATLAEILDVSPVDLLESDGGNPRSRSKSS